MIDFHPRRIHRGATEKTSFAFSSRCDRDTVQGIFNVRELRGSKLKPQYCRAACTRGERSCQWFEVPVAGRDVGKEDLVLIDKRLNIRLARRRTEGFLWQNVLGGEVVFLARAHRQGLREADLYVG